MKEFFRIQGRISRKGLKSPWFSWGKKYKTMSDLFAALRQLKKNYDWEFRPIHHYE